MRLEMEPYVIILDSKDNLKSNLNAAKTDSCWK